MQRVIISLAEAFWPANLEQAKAEDEPSSQQYLRSCGSDCAGLVDDVLKVIDRQLYGGNKIKVKLLLQIMSYRLPMLLLAGAHCLTASWPFVLTFPEMPLGQRQAMMSSWVHSALPVLRQAYKALKSILGAVLCSHIDPTTGTNPFFQGMGYVPGSLVHDTAVGPPPATAAQQEEVLSSATIDLPEVLSHAGTTAAAQAYLGKRGFSTQPFGGTDCSSTATSSGSTNTLPAGCAGGSSSIQLYYDAVVVGSGAGGGVTAAVLAAAGLKVLVLEKSTWVRAKDMSWMEGEAFDQMYERAGFLTTQDGTVVMLAGSTLGGGTKINWTASIRPPHHVREEWAAAPHGLTHLGPDSQAFTAALDTVCARLGVSTGTTPSTPNAKLTQGLQCLGLHVEEYARNCLSKTCSAYCNMGCRSGHKQSSEVWLADAVRAGAHILTGVQAQRVLTQRQQRQQVGSSGSSSKPRRVIGLQASVGDGREPEAATAAVQVVVHAPLVISSCGAINTPALLLRSGITSGGNVGANLRLHPALGLVTIFERTAEQRAAGRGAVEMYKGVSMGVFSRAAANWESGGYGAFISVPACQPGLLAAITPDHRPGYVKDLLRQLPDAVLNVTFTRDSSSGRVQVDRQGRPVISYWPSLTTRTHMVEGLVVTLRAMVAAGAVRIVVPDAAEVLDLQLNTADPPEVQQQQVDGLVQHIRAVGIRKYDTPVFSAHQMGSCRMGADSRTSACDPSGEVWDVEGLYVADGSAFPTASGVNPMITIYGVALLTAQGIARRWKQKGHQPVL